MSARKHGTAHVPRKHQEHPVLAQVKVWIHGSEGNMGGVLIHPEVAWAIAAEFARPGVTPGFTRMEATGEILFTEILAEIVGEKVRLNLNRELTDTAKTNAALCLGALKVFVETVQRELPKSGKHAVR